MAEGKQPGGFDTSRPLYRVSMTIYRVVCTGVLWWLCSLPLVTAGAACCAAVGEFTDPEGREPHHLVRNFFHRVKRFFRPATPLWLGFCAAAALLALAMSFYRPLSQGAGWPWRAVSTVLFVLADLLVGVLRFSFYHIAARDARSARTALREGARLALFCVPALAGMLLMDGFLFLFFVNAPYFLFLLAVLPGLLAMAHSAMIAGSLRRYDPAPKEEKKPSRFSRKSK